MEIDLKKVTEEAERALLDAVGNQVAPLRESEGEDDTPDTPTTDEAVRAEPLSVKGVLGLIFGKSSPGDVLSSVAGYLVAGAVAGITYFAPNITGETTVTQLVGMLASLGVAAMGRLIESNR
jgi:hypothetical protein